MISPPKRPGIDPHGSLLEPLWNLFREIIFSVTGRRKLKRQVFSELRGGRTRDSKKYVGMLCKSGS